MSSKPNPEKPRPTSPAMPPCPTVNPAIVASLNRFEAASLDLLAARALQKRVDSKFVAPAAILPSVFDALLRDFSIVLSSGSRWATYETRYYDTPTFAFFHAHRRGRRPRSKVRVRHYVERDVCFRETKTKDMYSVTTKHRDARDARGFDLDQPDWHAIHEILGVDEALVPSATLTFPRVTLVGREHNERLTVDLGIAMRTSAGELVVPNAAIIEIKQPRFDARSPAWQALRSHGLRRTSLSKYCTCIAATGAVERGNVFRPGLRALLRANSTTAPIPPTAA